MTAADVPLNEYTENPMLVMGSFPVQFPLGVGISRNACLDHPLCRHLLLQHHGVFGRKNTLLFLMCNQILRVEAVRAVNARVRASPESVQRYKEVVNDRVFVLDLHNAIVNNDEKAAKRVMAKITPILKVCSRGVPLSAGEGATFKSNMEASMHRCGPFNCFITFAPYDILLPLIQRMAFPTVSPEVFPARDRGFAKAMYDADVDFHGIPMRYLDLERRVADNPVAAEVVYNKLLEAVTSICFGEPMEQTIKKTGRVGNRVGVFGKMRCYCGATECQGRGCLHTHAGGNAGAVTPRLLENIAAYPGFVRKATQVMDSYYRAYTSLGAQVDGLLKNWHAEKQERFTCGVCPNPLSEPEAFDDWVDKCMESNNHHRHHFTCHHGISGKLACRMCYPRMCRPQSGLVQLAEEVGLVGSATVVEVAGAIPEKDHARHRERDRYKVPLNPSDERVLAFELARPDVFTCDTFEELVNDPVLPSDLSRELSMLPVDAQEWMLRCLKSRNSNTVETNRIICGLVGSNSCCYPLATLEQAKACAWYLVNYVVKDPVEMATALLLIQRAKNNAAKYRSTAEDAGTLLRDSQYLATKMVNGFTGAKEIPSVLASMICFGRRRYVSNHCYRFLNVTGAVRYVQDKYCNHNGAYDYLNDDEVQEESDGDGGSQSEYDEEEEDRPCVQEEEEILPSRPSKEQYGTVLTFAGKDGHKVVVYPVELYENRPLEFMRCLNMYEMTAVANVQNLGDSKDDNSAADNGEGSRACNWSGLFPEDFVLTGSHKVVLRSKQMTPKVGLGPPPSLPKGERPEHRSKAQASWDRQAARFAAFYLVAFKPWSRENPLRDLSWDAFLAFWDDMAMDGSVLSRTRMAVIENMAGFNRSSALKKRLLSRRRAQHATVWSHDYGVDSGYMGLHDRTKDGKAPKSAPIGSGGVVTSKEAACEDVQALLANQKLARLLEADSRSVAYEKGVAQYNANTVESLGRVFDTPGTGGQGAYGSAGRVPVVQSLSDPHTFLAGVRKMRPTAVPMPPEGLAPANHRYDEEHGDGIGSGCRQVVGDLGMKSLQFNGKHVNGCVFPRLPESLGINDLQPTGQRQVFDLIMTYIRRLNRYKHGLRKAVVPVPRILVHGPAGTGKTYTVCKLMVAAMYFGFKVLPVALQGSAASNIPGGLTIHHLTKVGVDDDGVGDCGVPVLVDKEMRDLLDGVAVIVIDEISMVPARLLYRLHERLCHVMRSKSPFGGLAVVALGDMYQIKPVRSAPLFSVVIDRAVGRVRRKELMPYADLNGTDLFLDFIRMDLQTDMRATDQNHAKIVASMRDLSGLAQVHGEGPMTEAVGSYMRERTLSYNDYAKDPSWLDAPIIVTSNRERGALTLSQAQRWGKVHGVPVVRWYYAFNLSVKEKKDDPEIRAYLYTHEPTVCGLFVEGAVAYLTQNINPRVGLSNGTRCFYHSLSFDPCEDPAKVEAALAKIRTASPGEIVDINLRPMTVNVRLEGETAEEKAKREADPLFRFLPVFDYSSWDPALNMVEGKADVVIPIPVPKYEKAKFAMTIPSKGQVIGSLRRHEVEPGFAITFHKVQVRHIEYRCLSSYSFAFVMVASGAVCAARAGADIVKGDP